MSPRHILIGLALLFLVTGVVIGLTQHAVYNDDIDEVSCGSVLRPENSFESLEVDCKSELSDAKPLTFGVLVLGVIAFIAAFVASDRRPEKPTPP